MFSEHYNPERYFTGLPTTDTPDFLDRPLEEEIEEALRDEILLHIMAATERIVLATDGSEIEFRESGNPSPSSGMYRVDFDSNNNSRYFISDPAQLFQLLDTNPSALSIECLNVVMLAHMYALRNALVARGHDPLKVAALFNATILEGDNTRLFIGDHYYLPWKAPGDKGIKPDDECASINLDRGREPAVGNVSTTFWVQDSDETTTEVIETELNFSRLDLLPGDYIYSNSLAVPIEQSTNSDAQNAIIMNRVLGEDVDGEEIEIAAHRRLNRRTTVTDIINKYLLASRRRGMTLEEYMDTGGSAMYFRRLEVVKLYRALGKAALRDSQQIQDY